MTRLADRHFRLGSSQRGPLGRVRLSRSMSTLAVGLAGTVAAALLGVNVARAQNEPPPSEPIAIVKLPFQGIAPEVAASLSATLATTLRSNGFSVLSAKDVENRLSAESRLVGCATTSCYGRLAQVLGVRRVIEGELQSLQLSTFSMKLQLRDLYTGKLTELVKDECSVCSNDEVRQMVMRTGEKLAKSAPPLGPQAIDRPTEASGILAIETEPSGAQVRIDGSLRVERTPASYLLAAGVHDLVVQGQGYRPLRQQIEILAGAQPQTLRLSLPALLQRRPWLTALAVVSTVGALGLAGGSGYLFYQDGRPVNTSDCPDQPGVSYRCPNKYDNVAPGAALAAGAGVLAITAGILFYLDNASPKVKPIVEAPASPTPPEPIAAPTPAAVPSTAP